MTVQLNFCATDEPPPELRRPLTQALLRSLSFGLRRGEDLRVSSDQQVNSSDSDEAHEVLEELVVAGARTRHPQKRIREQAVVRAWAALALAATRHQRRKPCPLVVREAIGIVIIGHDWPLHKTSLEADLPAFGNPKNLNPHNDLGLQHLICS